MVRPSILFCVFECSARYLVRCLASRAYCTLGCEGIKVTDQNSWCCAWQALMREGNARMQAMQHAIDKQPLHKGPGIILEDIEDESSDEEDIAQNVLAAAGAAASNPFGAASRGMEQLLRSSHDLAQGVSAHLEPALTVRYGTQLAQLADEGYDNVEVLLLLPLLPSFSKPTSRSSTTTLLSLVASVVGGLHIDMLASYSYTCQRTYPSRRALLWFCSACS